jgi:hypothetical protein
VTAVTSAKQALERIAAHRRRRGDFERVADALDRAEQLEAALENIRHTDDPGHARRLADLALSAQEPVA